MHIIDGSSVVCSSDIHLDGICHTYLDKAADPDMARTIVLNAKMRRTGICGAMETLLIDREFAAPAAVITALLDAGCEVRGDAAVRAIDGRVKAAEDADWDTEYIARLLSARAIGRESCRDRGCQGG